MNLWIHSLSVKVENKLPFIEDRGQTDRFTIVANPNPWFDLRFSLSFTDEL